MYTSYVGKKFLALYNQREGTTYSARTFFDEVFFPLFFDARRHLMHVGNSAFFQKPSKNALEGGLSVPQAQLAKLHADIEQEPPSMATFVGFAAKDMTGTTSGQLTNMSFGIDQEEMYASWIGQALGIGVSGGYVMLVDEEALLMELAEGWQYYRQYLSQTPNIKGNQIETWNGQWLAHRYGRDFDPDFPGDIQPEVAEVVGKLSIATVNWTRIVFALSRGFGNEFQGQAMTIYGYNLSQTNTTLGFVNLYLDAANQMYEIRERLLLNNKTTVLSDTEIEKLEPFFNFRSACMLGTIGLRALEPRGLRKYMPTSSFMYAQGKEFKFSDEASLFTYQLFKIWIIAMLNKTELLNLAEKLASALVAFENQPSVKSRGKSTGSQAVKEILATKHVRGFIDTLTSIMDASNADLFKELVAEILKMPADNFPLFMTLVKFEHTYQQSQS